MEFYKNFAAAYGTIWFLMMVIAIVSQSNVNAGAFGLFGFPIIALVYAAYKYRAIKPADNYSDFQMFLNCNPNYAELSMDEKALMFHFWMKNRNM